MIVTRELIGATKDVNGEQLNHEMPFAQLEQYVNTPVLAIGADKGDAALFTIWFILTQQTGFIALAFAFCQNLLHSISMT